MTEPIVIDADCCKNCGNTRADFTFRDAVLCFKSNKYQEHTETCQLFKKRE